MQILYVKLRTILNWLLALVPGSETGQTKPTPEVNKPPSDPPPERPTLGRAKRTTPNRLQKKRTVDVKVLQSSIIKEVIAPLNVGVEQSEIVREELRWLFAAADHLLNVVSGKINRSTPVSVPIPPEAKTSYPENVILPDRDAFADKILTGQVVSIFGRVEIHLKNLSHELDKQHKLGGSQTTPVALMNSIKHERLAIMTNCQELARSIAPVYGVQIYSLEALVKGVSEKN